MAPLLWCAAAWAGRDVLPEEYQRPVERGEPGVVLGFDLGTFSALRGGGRFHDGGEIGLRVGALGLPLAGAAAVYLDGPTRQRWQPEFTVGAGVGAVGFALAGIAANYDPPSGFQMNLGVLGAAGGGAIALGLDLTVGGAWTVGAR